MTLEQGWLHALILAHLIRPTIWATGGATADRHAAHTALRLVTDPVYAATWLRNFSPLLRPAESLEVGPLMRAEYALLRSLHRDAWAS